MRMLKEAADFINTLYSAEFSGKPHGRFRIANSELALLAGRQNISHSTVNDIRTILYEKHGLLLIDLRDEVAILKCRLLRRYRKASAKVITDVLGIIAESNETEDDE